MSSAVELWRGGSLSLFFVLFFLLFAPFGWAQTSQKEQTPTHVQADTLHYDEQQNTVTASGNVDVHKGETTLKADTVTVHRTTNELEAQGNVVVKDPQGQIDANALTFEMEDETGTIHEGTVRLPRNQFILTGETLQKSYGQTYHIENGKFTTCQCENFQKADWSIGGKTIDVTLRGKGEVHNGLFRVRDIPIAYIPYGTVSVRTDRQSGLLFPHYAFSSKRGYVWQQPLYWAINRSYDLTLTTDIETAARAGLWADFRYAPNIDIEGQLSASYFNEQLRGPATTSTSINRWSATGTHRQDLTDDVRLYGDLFLVSDKLFLREITHYALNLPQSDDFSDWTLRTRRFTDSRAGGVKTWDNAMLRAEATYYQDLVDKQSSAFQVFPSLQFQERQYLWHDRLEASVAVEGDNFYRNKGYAGQRFDLAPSLALPFHLGDYAFGSVGVTGRETAYHMTSQAPGPSTTTTPKLRGDQTREIMQFDAELGTRFSRVFDVNWGKFLKLQHIVEPEVSYRYIPLVNQDDLPFYDPLDRINKRNVFIYGAANRFLGKFRTTPAEGDATEGGAEIRELGRLTITQAYDPDRSLSREIKHYSDVNVSARFTPFSFTSFTFDSTYAVDNGHATTIRMGASLRDPRPFPALPPLLQHLQRTSNIGVTYRWTSPRVINQFNSGLTNPIDITRPKEVDTVMILRLTDSLMGSYIARYDLNTSSFLGNRYFLRYIGPQKCWYVDFGIIDKVNPREFEFRLLFTLVGLSSSNHTMF